MNQRYTVPEVAARLLSSHERVLRLIRAGELRAINTGTGSKRPRWIVDAEDLKAFEGRRANAGRVVKAVRPQPRSAVPNYFA